MNSSRRSRKGNFKSHQNAINLAIYIYKVFFKIDTWCTIKLDSCILHIFKVRTLRGDKVIMLTHTYPHKPLRKIKVTSAITTLTAHLTCDLMPGLVIRMYRKLWSYILLNAFTETVIPGAVNTKLLTHTLRNILLKRLISLVDH